MDTVCSTCGECCKRYAITVLPGEARAQAQYMGMPVESFMRTRTQLFIQLYPCASKENASCIHESMLPKKWAQGLETKGIQSNFYMVVPQVAFKKKKYCTFYDTHKHACSIHPVKPAQCSLFPFIPWQLNAEAFSKEYDFCELSRVSSPTKHTKADVENHQLKVNAYFKRVQEKGFERVWGALPRTGIVSCRNQTIARTNKKEILELLNAVGVEG